MLINRRIIVCLILTLLIEKNVGTRSKGKHKKVDSLLAKEEKKEIGKAESLDSIGGKEKESPPPAGTPEGGQKASSLLPQQKRQSAAPSLLQQEQLASSLLQQKHLSPSLLPQKRPLAPSLLQERQMPPSLLQKEHLKQEQQEHLASSLLQKKQLAPSLLQQEQLEPSLLQKGEMASSLLQHEKLASSLLQEKQMAPSLLEKEHLKQEQQERGESLGKNLPPVGQEGLSKSAKKKLKRNKSKLSTTSTEDEEKSIAGMTLRGDESAKEGGEKASSLLQHKKLASSLLQEKQMRPSLLEKEHLKQEQQEQLASSLLQKKQLAPSLLQEKQKPLSLLQKGEKASSLLQDRQLAPSLLEDEKKTPSLLQHGKKAQSLLQHEKRAQSFVQPGRLAPSLLSPTEPAADSDVNLNILNEGRRAGTWLDSSIIDAYLERIVSTGRPGLEFVPNFIIDMYVGNKKEHAEEIGNWIMKIDWPAIQLLFVPVFLAPNHWAMGVYRPSEQEFTMFDSNTALGRVSEKNEFMGKISEFFADISQIHGQTFDEDVHLVERTNVPQQDNDSDCGVFVLMFAYYIGKERRILDNFNHCNMNANAFREKIYQDLYAIKFGQQTSTAAGAAASTKIASLEQSAAAEDVSLGKNLPPVGQEGLSKSAKKKLKRNKSKLSTTSTDDEEKSIAGMTLRGDESAKEGGSKSGAMETLEKTLRRSESEKISTGKTMQRSESDKISTGKTMLRSESGKESTGKTMQRSESVKETTRKTLRKSVSSRFSDTQEQLRRIDEIAVLKDGAHTWRVKDMHLFGKNFLRVLNDDITGNAMHSAVEILKKGDNSIEAYVKRNLRMPFAKAMVIQLLANAKSQTTNMKILNIGLGGGELANFLAELDPTMDITSVEISPTIIQIATEYFDYKVGEKQHVINKDGIEYIEEAVREGNKFNWILIDACNLTEQNKLVCPVSGFIDNRIAQFISQLMSERGILVINTYATENSEEIKQERLAMKKIYEKHFTDCYFVEAGTNIIFTCVNGKKVDKKQYEEMEKKIRPIAGSWVKDALKVNTLFLPKL